MNHRRVAYTLSNKIAVVSDTIASCWAEIPVVLTYLDQSGVLELNEEHPFTLVG